MDAPGSGTPTGTVTVTGGSGCSAPVAAGSCVVTSTTAGDAGTKNNFGFNVKYNKSRTNLQGNINTIIRRTESDGILHVYQIKGNSMTSLAVKTSSIGGTATFNGKASIQDITNPMATISVECNPPGHNDR